MPFSISGTEGIVSTPTLNAGNVVASDISGDLTSTNILTTNLSAINNTTFNGRSLFPVRETIGLMAQPSTTATTGPANPPQWVATYTGIGGRIKVWVQAAAYASVLGRKEYSLLRNDIEVARCIHFFNQANIHLVMASLVYIDNSRTLSPVTYQVRLETSGMVSNSDDACTMIFTEF
jgi:hypothetical protein